MLNLSKSRLTGAASIVYTCAGRRGSVAPPGLPDDRTRPDHSGPDRTNRNEPGAEQARSRAA